MSQHFNETSDYPAERITDELVAEFAYDDWYDGDDDDDLWNPVYAAPYGERVSRRANMD